ncbi:MAG: hypothetical protein WKF83_12915 [Nocardioidaceae bacterium]
MVHQDYWRARGSWRPESWVLSFGVFRDGDLLGYQGLGGRRLREAPDGRLVVVPGRPGPGTWVGKQMRAAVLALAFGPLEARFAITSAWSDNHASLGASRKLGYVDNGITVQQRDGQAGEMVHLRLSRETWMASGWPEQVVVSGVDECLAFFGLH